MKTKSLLKKIDRHVFVRIDVLKKGKLEGYLLASAFELQLQSCYCWKLTSVDNPSGTLADVLISTEVKGCEKCRDNQLELLPTFEAGEK